MELEMFKEYWYSLIRYAWEDVVFQILMVIMIVFLGIVALKLIGKKSISQLTIPSVVFLFILTTTLGALIINPKALLIALTVIFTIICTVRIVEKLQFKYLFVEKLLVGKSVVLVENGEINYKALKKCRISISQLKSQLRLKDIESIEMCKTITYESNGNIGVDLKEEYEPIRKIYFDNAVKQILKEINNIKYKEIEMPKMENLFDETKFKNKKNEKFLE